MMKKSPLELVINDTNALHSHYMPFIKGGALFVPTTQNYALNSKITFHLLLAQYGKKIPVAGEIIWVNLEGLKTQAKQGIGVRLMGNNAAKIKSFLEKAMGELADKAPANSVY